MTSLNEPDNYVMSEADDEGTKASETSCSVKLVPNAKPNANNQLSLKKKKKLGNNSFKLRHLSIKERKFIIEERKFQAESKRDERKLGMLEQELAIKIEKLKSETEREWLHVDK